MGYFRTFSNHTNFNIRKQLVRFNMRYCFQMILSGRQSYVCQTFNTSCRYSQTKVIALMTTFLRRFFRRSRTMRQYFICESSNDYKKNRFPGENSARRKKMAKKPATFQRLRQQNNSFYIPALTCAFRKNHNRRCICVNIPYENENERPLILDV